jgi:hypothetical protein
MKGGPWPAALLFATCQQNAGNIVFNPSYQPPLPTQSFMCGSDPRRPFYLHVKLLADGQTYEQTVPFSIDVVQFDVPIGTMRSITMDLLNPQSCKLYSGARSNLSFAEGDNGAVVIGMRPPGATGDYADADHDGLVLCVENALGTKDSKVDSDGDGFPDFCEVTGAAGTCTNAADATKHPSGSPTRCNPTPDGGVDGGDE